MKLTWQNANEKFPTFFISNGLNMQATPYLANEKFRNNSITEDAIVHSLACTLSNTHGRGDGPVATIRHSRAAINRHYRYGSANSDQIQWLELLNEPLPKPSHILDASPVLSLAEQNQQT
ncbi:MULTISPECIES: hypothetical protein [Pseudomonas]|uniref:hypothetical protein n=1 Tax=Pseudomonas TaxID=286 RepID=UPI002B412660|nr:hypothetical protein [Pseudomonas sichuanensis]